jgi:tRNA A37 threonylcarbamoyladenosine synthetase subunit TsaC/SUA5/YrdC
MKQRNKEKPFFITVSDISNISEIAIYDERIDELISLHPEKTFTFILHRAYNLPEYINP